MKPQFKPQFKSSVSHHDFLMQDLKKIKTAVGYLNMALQEGDEDAFLLALHHVAEAQGGLSLVAKAAKIHRVSLHRILSKQGNPRLNNLANILSALGLKLAVIRQDNPKLASAA